MEERDFMFDAHNNQGWMSILQESVHVAINLTKKMANVVFRVIATVCTGSARSEDWDAPGTRPAASVPAFFGKLAASKDSTAFEDARVIQFQGENVEFEVLAGQRQ